VEVESCAAPYPCTSQPLNFATQMVCNFPDDEISLFIDSFTKIRSRFGPILEIYCSNLQTGKQYPRKISIWLVENNSYRGPDRIMKTNRAFGSAQSGFPSFGRERIPLLRPKANSSVSAHSGFPWFGPVRAIETQCICVRNIYRTAWKCWDQWNW